MRKCIYAPSLRRFSSSCFSLPTDRPHSSDHIQLGQAKLAVMMTPKSSLFGTVLLFACFLLLTPVVQSCYFFYATESDKGSGYAAVEIFENHTLVCDYFGFPIPEPSPSPGSSASLAPSPSGGDLYWNYRLTCAEGYAAVFDVDSNTLFGIVLYLRPGGLLGFEAPGDGGLWQICESGCTVAQCSGLG